MACRRRGTRRNLPPKSMAMWASWPPEHDLPSSHSTSPFTLMSKEQQYQPRDNAISQTIQSIADLTELTSMHPSLMLAFIRNIHFLLQCNAQCLGLRWVQPEGCDSGTLVTTKSPKNLFFPPGTFSVASCHGPGPFRYVSSDHLMRIDDAHDIYPAAWIGVRLYMDWQCIHVRPQGYDWLP